MKSILPWYEKYVIDIIVMYLIFESLMNWLFIYQINRINVMIVQTAMLNHYAAINWIVKLNGFVFYKLS